MRKALTKKQRAEIYAKCGGKCAYCGTELNGKFQADHVIPLDHAHRHKDKDLNHISNLMPSCAPCNNFKYVWGLEQFRRNLEEQVQRARQYSVNFRNAERFGLIIETKSKVTFYFERMRFESGHETV